MSQSAPRLHFLDSRRAGQISIAYLPTLPVFPGVSKFFIQSPGLPVRAPNLPGNTFRGFFPFFFINFKEIKLEVHLFELFSIEKRKNKAMESAYITDGYWY